MTSHYLSLQEVPPATIFGDRRAQPRCSIRLPMEFTVVGKGYVGQLGIGVLLDISSTGIAFRTSDEVECGRFVNVSIPWLSGFTDGITALKAYGRVVRNNQEVTAIQVLRYEFSRQESTCSPLVLPSLARPPQSRIEDPKASATARLRAEGSSIPERAILIRAT